MAYEKPGEGDRSLLTRLLWDEHIRAAVPVRATLELLARAAATTPLTDATAWDQQQSSADDPSALVQCHERTRQQRDRGTLASRAESDSPLPSEATAGPRSAPSGSSRTAMRRAVWARPCPHRALALESRHGEHYV